MGIDFWICILSLLGAAGLGISLAVYNLNDAEAREARLRERRKQRAKRKAKYRFPI